MAARRGSVDFENDAHSLSEKLWQSFVSTSIITGGERRPSLLQRSQITFDYFDEDADGKTPLMQAVENNYIKIALDLLLYRCNPNLKHQETGDTALHMAVMNGSLTLVKLLLAFDADPTIKNKANETPIDIALAIKKKMLTEDAPQKTIATALSSAIGPLTMFPDVPDDTCSKITLPAQCRDMGNVISALSESIVLRSKTRNYFASHSTVPSIGESSDTFLLSIDGGGMRILNVTQALVHIEERVSQLAPPGYASKVWSYFDYLAGTSSGALAACAFPYLQVDSYTGRAIVHRGLASVFSSPVEKRGENMDAFLQDMFTQERSMADLDSRYRVMVTTSLAHVSPYKLHFMTSYGEARDGQAGPRERKVWEACRVSTAAPTYFPILRDLKILDGGLLANNPTLDSMTEIIQQGKKEGKPVKFGCVLSLGTGITPAKDNEYVEIFQPSIFDFTHISQNIAAIVSLAQHYLCQVSLSDGQEVDRAQAFCDVMGCPYFRLTPPLQQEIDLASADTEIVIDMLYHTQMYYLDNPQVIDNVAKCILSKKLINTQYCTT